MGRSPKVFANHNAFSAVDFNCANFLRAWLGDTSVISLPWLISGA